MNTLRPQLPAGLASIAGTRDLITTPEIAHVLNIAAQTVRKNHSQGRFPLKPRKIGNKLLWAVTDVAKLMSGSQE